MKRLIAGLFIVTLFVTTVASADDGDDSLGLLVDTLVVTDDADVQHALLQGMLSGLSGRRNVPTPKGWKSVQAKLLKSENEKVRELTGQLSQVFGDELAMQQAIAVVKDSTIDVNLRRTSLHSLLTQQHAESPALLKLLLSDTSLRIDAIRGFASIESNEAPTLLLAGYEDFSPQQRRAVIETLATRKNYAAALLKAVKQNKIARKDVPAHVARSLHEILGDKFIEVFGVVRELAADRQQTIAKYKAMLSAKTLENADAGRGRVIFSKTCASCHMLYGEGGKIGPDLTGSNRANLDYILLNSVDPSYDVPAGYKMVTILTNDGRFIKGVVAEEDGARVVLKTVDQPRVTIAKEDIDVRQVSSKSMMPDGQLDQMKPQQVADLIKYLQTTEQVKATP